MKMYWKLLFVCISMMSGMIVQAQNLKKIFGDAEKKSNSMIMELAFITAEKPELISPRTYENGKLKAVASRDWTSGFFPGVLWFLYEFTGKGPWKETATTLTSKLEQEKFNAGTHDMGFKIYCSFGNGYRHTKDPKYREVIIQAAKTLSTRFNKTIGCIRSWDHNRDKWDFPVIIDNMMNLELLFAATRLTGDSSFYKIAVSHANTTMKNHFRPDYSSYHVIDYDSLTGQVRKRNTHQGFSHESAWSRGQAWALYGYTMCYRETKDPAYLQQAENIAKFILTHPNMPNDLVPYYDFDAPGIPNEPRDASAAAIIASALYELSTYSNKGKNYRISADKICVNLTDNYRSRINEKVPFILLHSTGSKPSNSEVD
ncbi:MAG TPA: glycoside hydrolase family 88 protein, partial [Chitinophagaceae bacterium]